MRRCGSRPLRGRAHLPPRLTEGVPVRSLAYELGMDALLAPKLGCVAVVLALHQRIAPGVVDPCLSCLNEFSLEVRAQFALARAFLECGIVNAHGSVAEALYREGCRFVRPCPESVIEHRVRAQRHGAAGECVSNCLVLSWVDSPYAHDRLERLLLDRRQTQHRSVVGTDCAVAEQTLTDLFRGAPALPPRAGCPCGLRACGPEEPRWRTVRGASSATRSPHPDLHRTTSRVPS